MFVFGPAGVGFAGRDGVGRSASPMAQRVHRGGLHRFLLRDGNVVNEGQFLEVGRETDGCNTSSLVFIVTPEGIITVVLFPIGLC